MKKLTALFMSVWLVLCMSAFNNAPSTVTPVSQTDVTLILGDVDSSGKVDAQDALMALQAATSRITLNEQQVWTANVDTDQQVTANDALLILQYATKKITVFPKKPDAPTPEPVTGKTLIVYFSWSSNTERMANTIKEQTGGDLLELVPVNAYPTDYTACTEVALAERDSNARPAIQNLPSSIEEYDNILIGYPIWWHTAPMIIGTFLETYDLTGVDVYPFTQSASMDRTQFNNSMEFVRACAEEATVHDGLFARYSDTATITAYLNTHNLTK